MEGRGVILDVSHLVDASFWDALASFDGPVLASHANCRALVPGDRQLSDDMIRALIERDGVIGAALDASTPSSVTTGCACLALPGRRSKQAKPEPALGL